MSTMKTFPLDGTRELLHWNLCLLLNQCELLKQAGFTHIREEDIPLSSDDYDIDEYINLITEKLLEKPTT